jgi:YidC/Oxa1 family membrane protein insertase
VNPLDALYDAVGWVLTHIYYVLKPAFGASSGWTWALTIVILVVLMRLLMVPLFIRQMHTTRAMSALQPQMAALRKKYKNDKQTLNQETMKLYQEAGVNPLMGCLPFVLQLPLFFSLFSVLRAIADWKPHTKPSDGLPLAVVQAGHNAEILGAKLYDKVLFTDGVSVPLHAKLIILAAVAVSMSTTYLTIRQSMKRGMMPAATPDNPMASTQKYMAYIMPLFALTGLYWPFGLVLYWCTTNIWTLCQQYLLGRRTATASALTAGSPRGQRANGRATAAGKATGTRGGAASTNGASSDAGGGSMLRRLGKRSEPEPPPAEPEVKLVRHQTQRQTRSKRSGGKR